jgi:hypothetical protein
MRKFLFIALAATALGLPATARPANASWLSQWLHAYFDRPVYDGNYYYYDPGYIDRGPAYSYEYQQPPVYTVPGYTYTPSYYPYYVSPYYVPSINYSRPGWYRPWYGDQYGWHGRHWDGWYTSHYGEYHRHH